MSSTHSIPLRFRVRVDQAFVIVESVPGEKPELKIVGLHVDDVMRKKVVETMSRAAKQSEAARRPIVGLRGVKVHAREVSQERVAAVAEVATGSTEVPKSGKRGSTDASLDKRKSKKAAPAALQTKFTEALAAARINSLNAKIPAAYNSRRQENPIRNKRLETEALATRVRLAALKLVATRLKDATILRVNLEKMLVRPVILTPQDTSLRNQNLDAMAMRSSLATGIVHTVETNALLSDARAFLIDPQAPTNYINSHFLDSLRPHRIRISGGQGEAEYVSLAIKITRWFRSATPNSSPAQVERLQVADLGPHGPRIILGAPWVEMN